MLSKRKSAVFANIRKREIGGLHKFSRTITPAFSFAIGSRATGLNDETPKPHLFNQKEQKQTVASTRGWAAEEFEKENAGVMIRSDRMCWRMERMVRIRVCWWVERARCLQNILSISVQ